MDLHMHTHTLPLLLIKHTTQQANPARIPHIYAIYSLMITYTGQEVRPTKTYLPTYMPLQGGASIILCVYTGFLPQSIYKHHYKVRERNLPKGFHLVQPLMALHCNKARFKHTVWNSILIVK